MNLANYNAKRNIETKKFDDSMKLWVKIAQADRLTTAQTAEFFNDQDFKTISGKPWTVDAVKKLRARLLRRRLVMPIERRVPKRLVREWRRNRKSG